METDAYLRCPACKYEPYKLMRKPAAPGSDVFIHIIEPHVDGKPKCPKCEGELLRVDIR